MRNLLFFGTGAALIGLLFLILAFYESYLIVSALQRQLVLSAIDTTRLLEDAVLEAVFLGIMSGIGYALISKGLDGIRREELLQAEGAAEVTFARHQTPSGSRRSRFVARSNSSKIPVPKSVKASGLHPGIKQQGTQASSGNMKADMQVRPKGVRDPGLNDQKSVPESVSASPDSGAPIPNVESSDPGASEGDQPAAETAA